MDTAHVAPAGCDVTGGAHDAPSRPVRPVRSYKRTARPCEKPVRDLTAAQPEKCPRPEPIRTRDPLGLQPPPRLTRHLRDCSFSCGMDLRDFPFSRWIAFL